MNDFESSFQIIKNAIESDLWSQRLPIIKKTKEHILEYYGFFPTLERVLEGRDSIQLGLYSKNTRMKVCFIHSCNLELYGTEKLDIVVNALSKSGLLLELDHIIINNIGIPLDNNKYTAISKKIEIIQHSSDATLFEIPTLKLMHKYSQLNPGVKVLYLHSKGISYSKSDPRNSNILDWIHYMLYFLVDSVNYKKCLELLDFYDTIGCDFIDDGEHPPHYSGNFWWSTTDYLKTLSISSLKIKHDAEWWLLSGSPKKYSFHNSCIDHYWVPYPRKVYSKKSLVVYTYFQSPSSDYNLDFYCKHAISNSDEIDYCIVINGHTCNVNKLPSLSNLKIIYRDNSGFDFGGHKAALDSLGDKKYDYYFFMNSGVIGPFLHEQSQDWTIPFIQKITEKVKLVGTSILCLQDDDSGNGPQIEGFFFMTDRLGLEVLLKEETIFYNHTNKNDCIKNGEYSLSKCMFKNGYTIDCMLTRYKGLDWLDKANWSMNNCIPPSRKHSFYGTSINPFEVIFHKWYWHNFLDSPVSFDIVEQYVKSKA